MAWNSKVELVKRSAEIAKEKHPNGFSKAQLIASSKEVFGGFGASPNKKIKTLEDVNNAGNAMAFIDGHYPVGMDGCFVVGISGGCGVDCPVFIAGDCGEPQEFDAQDIIDELGEEEAKEVMESYSCFS